MSGSTPALFAAAAGVGFGHAILPDHWVPLAVLGRARRYPLSKVARLSWLAGVAHVLLSIALGGVIIAIGLQFRAAVQSAQDTIIGCLLIATGVGFAIFELSGHGHSHGEHGHSHAHHEHDHDRSDHSHAHHDHDRSDHSHAHHDHDGSGHSHAHHDHDRSDHSHAHHDHDRSGRSHAHHDDDSHSHPHDDSGHSHGLHDQHDHEGSPERGALRGLAAVMVPFGAAASPDLTILPVFLAATTVGVPTAVGSLAIFAAVTIGTIVGLTLTATRGGYQIQGQWLDRWGNGITAAVLVVIGALVLTGVI